MAKLYFRHGTMSSGKSLALLQVVHNYEQNDRSVQVFTPSIDDRFGRGLVGSRLGLRCPADLFDETTDFKTEGYMATINGRACILIDEAQFLTPEQVTELHRLAHLRDMPVIAYGLRTDFTGKPFAGSIALLALADDIEELKTVCRCGKKATMNMRLGANGTPIFTGEQVEIGGDNKYRQVCPDCFYSAQDTL